MIKKMLIALMRRRNKKHNKLQQVYDSPSPPPSYMRLKPGGSEPCSIIRKGRASTTTCKASAVASCRKGYVPVMVVGGASHHLVERFLIPIELMAHPSILALMDLSAQEFGFEQEGAIQIPCDPDYFRDTVSHLKYLPQIKKSR